MPQPVNQDSIALATTTITIISSFAAALLGAIAAFWFQNKAEKKREKKQILAVLMAYRGLQAREDDFVKALNMIDVFYYDSKQVRSICHEYFKHLYRPLYDTGHHERLLHDLIVAMAHDVGYKELTHADITDYYLPIRYLEQTATPPPPITP
jgi:NH3-dependent NAD+ synthetase